MTKESITKLRKMGQYINILYVEDDLEIAKEFETLFRKVFKHIDVVYSGEAGLEKYKKGNYNIVITDIQMPNMNGIELIHEIKKINPEQLIVVTSAYNDSKYLQELIESGIEKFLLKPFNMSKLFHDIAKIVAIVYNKKREKQLQEQLEEKIKLNQLLLDKMIMPLAVITQTTIKYKNEQFNELFSLDCSSGDKDCYISTIFENEKIAQLNHKNLIEYLELHTSEKLLYLKNGLKEHFKVVVSHLEGTSKSLISFINTEVVCKEIDKLKAEIRLDTLTQLYTRETFVYQLDTLLDKEEEYYALCFGLKNLKEFIRLFGVNNLRDIYKLLSRYLQSYLVEEIKNKDIELYYFDTNHFVALIKKSDKEKYKNILQDFAKRHEYTNINATVSESMHLDILGVSINKTLATRKILAEIENQLYMLKGKDF